MARHIVAGTGFDNRAIGIRKWCKVGMPVILEREADNKFDANAIAVSITASVFFGLFKSLFQIGYIKAEAAKKIADKLDAGYNYKASVISFYAPNDRDFPRVSIDVIFDDK